MATPGKPALSPRIVEPQSQIRQSQRSPSRISASPDAPGRRPPGPEKRLLIADDDAGARKLYERELGGAGYSVYSAADGRETLRKAEEIHPDLVVLDIQMPGMDGIEVLQRLLDLDRELAVILNSAHACFRESYLSWPADAYLLKSSDLTELMETVNGLLAPTSSDE